MESGWGRPYGSVSPGWWDMWAKRLSGGYRRHESGSGILDNRLDTAQVSVGFTFPGIFGEFKRNQIMDHRNKQAIASSDRSCDESGLYQMVVRHQKIDVAATSLPMWRGRADGTWQQNAV
mgnify:CR=1 FL=1